MANVQEWSPARSAAPLRSSPWQRGPALVGRIVVILGTAVALGVLTAYAQGWVHGALVPLPNSAGPWVLVAFALAALTRTRYGAVLAGIVVLWLLELAYAVGAQAGGHPSSTLTVSFWLAAAVLSGPAIGLAGHAVRHGPAREAALGGGVLLGALAGEAAYMIHDLGFSRYPAAQVALAAALFVVMAARRFPRPADVALSLVAAAPVALLVMDFLHRT